MISTPYIPVPPPRYGGTELIVHELVSGLRELGHEVLLFTTGRNDAHARSLFAEPVWPPELHQEVAHAAWAVAELDAADPPVDVIHAHCPTALPLARFAAAPMIYTIHHPRGDELSAFYALQRGARYVTISARQRRLMPELGPDTAVVHHGLNPARYPLGAGGVEAVYLGRLAREKGPEVAMDVAHRAGVRLLVAGVPHRGDEEFYRAEIAPRRRRHPGARLVGEVDHQEKLALLGRAGALLFPIDWEEPFGLVMIEAMLCGTPVLAFARGAAPEIVDDGVTGWLCSGPNEMQARLEQLVRGGAGPGRGPGFDRRGCREHAIARFSRERMVSAYLECYRHALAESDHAWDSGAGHSFAAESTAGDLVG